jgi:hypothetical protein
MILQDEVGDAVGVGCCLKSAPVAAAISTAACHQEIDLEHLQPRRDTAAKACLQGWHVPFPRARVSHLRKVAVL